MSMVTTNQNDSAIEQATPAPPATLKEFLNQPKVLAELARVATSALKPTDLVNMTLTAAARNKDILMCTPSSIIGALVTSALLGIRPGGLMGRGYLVPRRNKHNNNALELCFDPGWRGLVDIARRPGKIRRIEAHVAYEAEDFEVTRVPFTTISHVPRGDLKEADTTPMKVRAAYAVCEFIDGAIQTEVVWKRDLDKIRKLGAGNGPWSTWYEEMARKTAVRRLCKYLPFDPMLEQALQSSDDADAIDVSGEMVTQAPTTPEAQTMSIAERARARTGAIASPPPSQPDADPETGELPMTDSERMAAIERGEA